MKLYPIFLLLPVLFSFDARSQNPKELPIGYYVVVAAFSPNKEYLAQRFTDRLSKKGLTPSYGFNTKRNYYYVYLSKFDELPPSVHEMRATRKNPEFPDAWVRIVKESGEMVDATAAEVVSVREDKAQDKSVAVQENSGSTETKAEETTQPATSVTRSITPQTQLTENKQQDAVTDTSSDITAVSGPPVSYEDVKDNPEIVQHEKMTLENTEVFLSLFNARNNKVVEGMIKVVDTEKGKLLKEVKGNDYLYLPDPKTKTKQVSLICEAFGYRKVQHELNFATPLADTVKDYVDLMGTTVIVYFDLVRYQVGDIGTLYHVYFYNDASIMLPESKFELTSLLEMMNENPEYRVRLHGHTNGNYHGKIITMGDDKNFFSIDGSKNTVGSAKDLSRQRAETIKDYLEANGVDPSRIEIKAWGGKKPIVDKHSANAKKNVRVEVEILNE